MSEPRCAEGVVRGRVLFISIWELPVLALVLLAGCQSSTEPEKPALERPASAPSAMALGDLRPEVESEDGRAEVARMLRAARVAAPIDSDLASVFRGGGCYPPGIATAGLDQLILIDPEWAPAVNGTVVESAPVLMHGTVVGSHGDLGGDFPATHAENDQNTFIRLDDADSGRLATGNRDGLLDLEWEVGAYPDWAWASHGDGIVALGRWIFDCGHPEPVVPGTCSASAQRCLIDSDCGAGATCNGTHFGYRTEMHPPQATAVLRGPHGAVIVPAEGEGEREAEPQLATRADVFVSGFGGPAGDGCVLTHRDSINALIGTNCFPLSMPVAPINDLDFSFDLPLPPRPHRRSAPVWRIDPHPTPGAPGRPTIAADLSISPVLDVPEPHLAVTVRMSHATQLGMPTGFAASIVAGWRHPKQVEFTHVRVFIDGIVVRNPLKPAGPVSGRDAPGWRAQAAVNGDWRQLSGLESVAATDAGRFLAQSPPLVTDLFLSPRATLRIVANGASSACVDTMFGQSLGTDLFLFGFDLAAAITCLNAVARNPGTVDASFSGPEFGARDQPYQTLSRGGEGQLCSGTPAIACAKDVECPAGETCAGAFALRYRIEEGEEARTSSRGR
jgi:hypothetical protein